MKRGIESLTNKIVDNENSRQKETKWLDITGEGYLRFLLEHNDKGQFLLKQSMDKSHCNYFLKHIEKNGFTALALKNDKVTPKTLSNLFRILIGAKSVDRLDLSHAEIDKIGAQIIANDLPFTSLKHLNLDSNKIGDEGAKAIASVLPVSTIENLNLSNTGIRIKGILAILKGLPSKVTNLTLSHNKLSAKDCLEILNALPTTVTTLDLSCNDFGNEGAKVIAKKLRGNTSLKVLKLRSNKIGKESTKAIIAMLSSTKLEELNLSGNLFGSDDIILITRRLPSTSLTTIDFSYNWGFRPKLDSKLADKKNQRNVLFLAPMLWDTQVITFDLSGNDIRKNTIENLNKTLEGNKQKLAKAKSSLCSGGNS